MLSKLAQILTLLILLSGTASGQATTSPTALNKILVGAEIVGTDTFASALLDEFEKFDKLPRHLARKQEKYNRLKYNIYKVYPYAAIAADILKNVDQDLAKIGDDKKARKQYLNGIEKELNKRFKGELENLTISQGQVLVKLINRQTGKNCFGIIKELKGGFSAVVWQSVALLFSNSLKKEYDPHGADHEMEVIVADLEATQWHKYKYQLQQNRAQARR